MADALQSTFEPLNEKVEKATNAGKFLYNTFFTNIDNELPVDAEFSVHANWIHGYYRRHENDKSITRFHLQDLFGSLPDDRRMIRRSLVRRNILQRKLCHDRLELILQNRMIPAKNKEHYLYFSKVYEWRLNSSELVSRFN